MQAEAGERDNKGGGENFPLCHPLQTHFSISDFFSPVFSISLSAFVLLVIFIISQFFC